MIAARYRAQANDALRLLPPGSQDLVFTSPPAYPSQAQEGAALGKEPTVSIYAANLVYTLLLAKRALRPNGFMVLVLEPQDSGETMGALRRRLPYLRMRMLATYHWSSGDGGSSWVVFLGNGGARLNRSAPAWPNIEWAIPRSRPKEPHGFYEWPDGLVEAVVTLTIPQGGAILDPFAGRAAALGRLDSKFAVTVVDMMPL